MVKHSLSYQHRHGFILKEHIHHEQRSTGWCQPWAAVSLAVKHWITKARQILSHSVWLLGLCGNGWDGLAVRSRIRLARSLHPCSRTFFCGNMQVPKGTWHRTLVQSVPDDNCGRLSFVSQSESLAKSEIKGQVVTCLGREERILCFHHLSPSGIHIALFSFFMCSHEKK